jgi:small nuclear ribonucleoprotein (snRNP)-like protein
MIPDTAGALLAFLGLVAPGLLYELRRGRRRPQEEESAFREASRVALTSFAFTVAALVVVVLLQELTSGAFVDLSQWIERGNGYARRHPALIARTVLLEVFLACGFAMLTDFVQARVNRETGQISSGGLWFQSLRQDKPPDAASWVQVRLTDGTTFWGFVRGFTASETLADREIVLEGAWLRQQDPPDPITGQERAPVRIGTHWECVLLRGDLIRYIRVQYVNEETGELQLSLRRLEADRRAAGAAGT